MNFTFPVPSLCSSLTVNEQLFIKSVEFWKEQQEHNNKTFVISMLLSITPILGSTGLIATFLFIASRIFTIRKLYRRRINNINLKIFENFLVLIAEFEDNEQPHMHREHDILNNKIKVEISKMRKYSNKEIFLVENEFKLRMMEEKSVDCGDSSYLYEYVKPSTSNVT